MDASVGACVPALEALRHQQSETAERTAELEGLRHQQSQTSERAAERQDRVHQLERVIEGPQGEVHRRKAVGSSVAEVSEAEAALRDARAIHSDPTR